MTAISLCCPVETQSQKGHEPRGVSRMSRARARPAPRARLFSVKLPGVLRGRDRAVKEEKAHLDGSEMASAVKIGPLCPFKEMFLALT